jgi:uncharacterized protein YxeA
MKKIVILLLITFIFISCTKSTPVNNEGAVGFFNRHVKKVIAGDLKAAYQDYNPDFQKSVTLEGYKNIFENQMEAGWGKLKSATYKSVATGTKFTIGKVHSIYTIYYKADVSKPNTYIKAQVTEAGGNFYVDMFTYINFVGDNIPDNLK